MSEYSPRHIAARSTKSWTAGYAIATVAVRLFGDLRKFQGCQAKHALALDAQRLAAGRKNAQPSPRAPGDGFREELRRSR